MSLAAGSVFQEGLSLYSEGQIQAASSRFIAAARANERFDEAYAWAGRTLLESGYPERAIPYWEALAERRASPRGRIAAIQSLWSRIPKDGFVCRDFSDL